ncbi:hypothetical protein NEOLEDRAFT_1143840 [Neolentinus lepideus HHB14362 ss-1]|uniref:Uncharacterized protein n=1 Tax=Neolentinus lepideus HHB14362 ss-1 TaxID=1314782 RepID=A0A165MAS2_9AGAM|nr:hypothetical protein NEOLEDRAFT_1143840 [Neolentinus lepideus HHB14362 ss-1]
MIWCCNQEWAHEKFPTWVECAESWMEEKRKRFTPVVRRKTKFRVLTPPQSDSEEADSDVVFVDDEDVGMTSSILLNSDEYESDAGGVEEEFDRQREQDELDEHGNLKNFVVPDEEDTEEEEEDAVAIEEDDDAHSHSQSIDGGEDIQLLARHTSSTAWSSDEADEILSDSSIPDFTSDVLSSHSTRASSISSDSNTESDSPRRFSPYHTRRRPHTLSRKKRSLRRKILSPLRSSDDEDDTPVDLDLLTAPSKKRVFRKSTPSTDCEDDIPLSILTSKWKKQSHLARKPLPTRTPETPRRVREHVAPMTPKSLPRPARHPRSSDEYRPSDSDREISKLPRVRFDKFVDSSDEEPAASSRTHNKSPAKRTVVGTSLLPTPTAKITTPRKTRHPEASSDGLHSVAVSAAPRKPQIMSHVLLTPRSVKRSRSVLLDEEGLSSQTPRKRRRKLSGMANDQEYMLIRGSSAER